MSIGEKISERRKKLGLTRRQVALAIGVVDSTVQKWELGIHPPKLDPVQMRSLCQVLQVSLDELADAADSEILGN
jgi:transcriptional regulator with XRE-family HTH domain